MSTPLDRAREMFQGKRVLIMGLGLLGGAAGDARFFCRLGAKVTATDLKTPDELSDTLKSLESLPIEYHLSGHREDDILATDYILRNPSVPINHPLLELARKLNKPVLMRSSLFASLAGANLIGVTGTRGKTTTTTMIYQLLTKHLSQPVLLGGNIQGVSDLELLDQITDPSHTIVVMELSSWQLQGFRESQISPQISVITNLYPDHLNRYPDLDTYYADKKVIFDFQHPTDIAILNRHQPEFHQWSETIPGQVRWFSATDLPPGYRLSIPGSHNLANAAAAVAAVTNFNIDASQALADLAEFKGVSYRLETIADINGVKYVNDTTATTPVATLAALSAQSRPPLLIAGGADKQLPLTDLAIALNHQTKQVILLQGSGTDQLLPLLDPQIIAGKCDSMAEAVNLAASLAESGDTVLLSPGFASFGLFINEFDRGDQFNSCVRNLS